MRKGTSRRLAFDAAMGTGGLNYICPTCGNPLFFTFRVVETKEGLKKRIHCPGCRTVWVVDLKMAPEKDGAPV